MDTDVTLEPEVEGRSQMETRIEDEDEGRAREAIKCRFRSAVCYSCTFHAEYVVHRVPVDHVIYALDANIYTDSEGNAGGCGDHFAQAALAGGAYSETGGRPLHVSAAGPAGIA